MVVKLGGGRQRLGHLGHVAHVEVIGLARVESMALAQHAADLRDRGTIGAVLQARHRQDGRQLVNRTGNGVGLRRGRHRVQARLSG
ncbi:MAG: hypothetical protein U1E76_22690 [Planctomycetota bacterium]